MLRKLIFLTAVFFLLGIVATPASAGLVSWWKFDDGSGSTAVDSGSAGNDGSVSGPQWVTGKLNGGLDFDGPYDYVEIPNESDYDITSSITVAAWLKLDPGDTTTNFMSFVTKGHESAWALQRNAKTSNVSFVLNGLTSWDGLKGSADVFDGEWHHVAGVYDGSRISIYVDATEDTFTEITGSIGTNDWGVFIGANAEDVNSSNGYRHCNGIIDDVRIYNHALTESEIAVLAGFDPAYPRNPNPRDGAKSVDPNDDLSWTAGSESTSSDVYFGTNYNDVENATTSDDEYMGNQTATTYEPGSLATNTYYYWRIDAIDTSDPNSPWVGDVWTFKTSSGQADECTNWQTLHPEWIFCDDFEDETSMVREGRYFAYDSDDGDFVITDEAGFNNSKGMRVIFQQSEVSAGGMKLGFGRTPSSFDQGISNTEDFREIYYRMYLKMEDGWTGNPAKLSRATIFHSNDWSQAMIAHLWQGTGYALGIDPVRCVNSSSEVVCIGYNDFENMTWLGAQSGSTPVFRTDHSDTWYCVEAHVKLNDAGYSNGLQEFWIDGELETSKTGLNFVESYTDYAINILLFENYWNSGSPQLQERYFDNIVVSTEEIGEFGAGPQYPGQASSPSPGNGTSDIGINTDLSWTAGSGATSHDVYFGTSSPGTFQGNQTATTFDTGTMSNNTTYYWRIDEINAQGTTTGVVWNFTTEAAPQPPGQATNPNPSSGATNVDIDANLSWTAGSGSTSSDVYFGTDSTPDAGEFQGNQTATTYEPGTMSYSTTYYWRIDEVNAQGTTTGNVWNFTTESAPQPPGQAGNPSPADSATDVSVDADLSWNAGSGATSRDVYFGTSSPGTFQGNQTATTFDCGSMSNDTTYYWRIDEINAAGTTTGNVWSFTTEAAAAGDVEIIGSWTSGTTHSEETGTNRALIFIAHAESSADTSDLGSVTYGGQSMTKVVERNMHYSYSAYTCAFILDEDGIDAATSSTFSPSWNTAPSATPAYTSVFLQNVNQTTLVGATGTGGTTTTTAETSALSTNDGDMAIVAGTCGNDATYSTINGFTEAIEVSPSSADGIGGYLACTGANVTPGVSHTNVNRQSVIGFVVKASTGGPTPPGQASTPNPANSATDVSITATLSWTAGTDATSHDVYFGTSSPGAFQGNQTAVTFDPGTLSYDTTYYWRIDEVNTAGTTTGNVWNFTTEAAPSPPGQASNPSPANSATDVSITADLSWTAGTNSTSSDVYFGTTSPGTFQGNQTATTFDPGTMANDTTYYWRIDEINAGGTTTGNVWSFTTIESAGEEIIGWWELNDGSGTTATDSSTYENDGTLVGSPDWTDDTERGWCLDFTGADNYVTIPNESDYDLTGSISVMGWMKASYVSWRNFSTIIAKGEDGSGGWALQKAGKTNGMSFYVNVSGMPWNGIKAGVGVFDNDWHHVAGVYDGSNAYIYIDGGVDSNSVACSGNMATNNWDVWIGDNSETRDGSSAAREWEGLIDDVRIYNYALTQSEVNDIYTGGAPTPPGQASNPSPAQSATNISINADLSWDAGTGSTSSDVYFGTDSTPDSGEFKGNQTATTYDPGTMANDTTYYWRIDEVNAAGTTTGTVWNFTTIVSAPGQASSPSPANAATNVDINANLSWSAGSGATSHDVYFGTSSPGAFQGNQTAATFEPGTMSNDTTYYWRIDEVNAAGTTTGTVWNFTTIVAAPGQASSPSPANTATDVDIDANLSWSVGSGATSHDVYFGTSSPGSYQGNQAATTFEPGTMANDTTYYWRIDEVNAGGTTTGSVWSFTTEEAAVPPPGQASNPSPADSAANVAVNTDLSWTAGSDTTSHDVYFGTSSPGSYQGNQTATTFDTGTMSNDTTYYWRIDEVGLGGTTTGNVWSFTTIVAAPGQASNPSPGNGATDVSIDADLSWSAGSGATSHDVYFGTSSPGTFQGNQTATTFDTGSMSNDTTYYWRIDEINVAGTTTGSVWNFTTIVAAAGQASSPSPSNSATDVSVSADLSWTAGSGATSHDVYFGTTSPGTFQGNQTATTFDPGTMSNDTTYYWRIDELNAAGTTTGSVWNFTTVISSGDQVIGWWELDEGSGSTAADSSTNGNDGTLVGSLTWTNDAERGWCLDFTGDNNYITIPNESDYDLTGNITVMGWMKDDYIDWRNFSTIIAKGQDAGDGWALQKASRDNAMSFYVDVSGMPWDGIQAGVGIFDNQWHHVAGVYDGSNAYIYIDGGLDSNSVACSGNMATNNWDVWIGENSQSKDGGSNAREWNGLISDVRVYNYALSQSEVNDIYTGGAPTLPGQASSPSPSDSATDVSIDADLSWTAGSDTTSHDVYFGTDSTPDAGEFQGNQTATTYDPGTMSNNTTYYWRIDEVNAEGTTTGNVWSFTTVAASSDVEIIGSWVSGTSHTKESGSNRLLVFTAHAEDNNADMNITSVTYGGQSMTEVIEDNEGSGYRAYVGLFVLDEDGIDAASGSSFVVTWAEVPNRTPAFTSVFMQNVNQTSPVGASASNGGTTATISTSALSTNDGDMVVLAASCGNTGTYSVNNGFTEAIELGMVSADGVAGYKAATGANETPSVTHSNINRQVIAGLVVQAQ